MASCAYEQALSRGASPRASLYVALFVAFSLLFAALLTFFLYLTYRQTNHGVEVSSQNEARILAARTDSTLRRIEASSNYIAARLLPELSGAAKTEESSLQIQRELTALAAKFPEISEHFVFNATGNSVYVSGSRFAKVNIADRDYFRLIRENPQPGLHFSQVLISKITGLSAVVAYQAVLGRQGEFLGLVGSEISLNYFSGMFSRIEVGQHGIVSIRRSDDSHLVVRWPDVPVEINKGALQTPSYQRIEQGELEGVVRYIGKADGVDRIFAFHKISDYPFYVLVGRAVDEQFEAWRHTVFISLLLSVGGLLILGMMLQRLLRSEKSLREASLFLSNTQAIAHVGGWKASPSENKVFWTEEVYRLLEHPLDQAPASLEEGLTYYAPEYLPKIKEKLLAAWESGAPFVIETEMIARSGRRFWAELRCVGRVEEQESTYITGTFQDVTDRKAAEFELAGHRHHLEELVEQRTAALAAAESNAQRILASSADGLYGVDRRGRVTFINPAACNMLGYTPELVIGKGIHALIHHSYPNGSPYPESECVSHKALESGHSVRVENEVYWHADGHPIPVMYAAHPIVEAGEPTGAVVSFVDMSHQRASEEAREKALLAAENLARARSEFLANMSHEIRTPLNGVIGFAEIGQRNYQDSEKVQLAFSKIRQSGKILLGVINDILDFSKIEAGKLSIESIETSLTQTIASTIDLVEARARDKSLVLQVMRAPELPDRVISDPIRVQQVLVNLLSNAIKFTDAGKVSLSLARAGEMLVLTVSDSGIGMTDEQLSRIFTPFEQGDGSTTRKFGGTGLGLAIVKRIVELMNGTIEVSSEPGKGSQFTVQLPFVPVDPSGELKKTAMFDLPMDGQPLRGIRILVAEDNEINQEILVDNLLEEGAKVIAVGNGREALQRILEDGADAYDIVLMDIQMPEMNGHEATREILKVAPSLPIVGQTAHAFAEEINACFASGMVGYIGKPIDPNWLSKVVLEFARHPPITA